MLLQRDTPYREHPTILFYKLANQRARIQLTCTPPRMFMECDLVAFCLSQECKVTYKIEFLFISCFTRIRSYENDYSDIVQTCKKSLLGGHGKARRTATPSLLEPIIKTCNVILTLLLSRTKSYGM